MKHTPGPWHVDKRNQVVCAQGLPICPDVMGENPEIYQANAQLIAAAPELLEALKALREAVKAEPVMNNMKYDSLGVLVNKAIAKAEHEE